MNKTPLIMLTNDDGIASPGLLALAAAVNSLGDLLIVAPRHQQSATSRSYIRTASNVEHHHLRSGEQEIEAFSIEASPALAVRYGILRFAAARPDLIVSGINYGDNAGAGVTVSGTVGAAWEGAAHGIPAIAVSLEVEIEQHIGHSEAVDFTVAGQVARRFAEAVLANGLPQGVSLLNINVPMGAAADVPWRVTRVSPYSHYHSTVKETETGEKVVVGYHRRIDLDKVEEGTDLYTLYRERKVSVTPISTDITARADVEEVRRRLDWR